MRKIAFSLLDTFTAVSPLASALYGGGQWSLLVLSVLLAKLRVAEVPSLTHHP